MYREEFDLKRFARLRIKRRKGFVQQQNLRVDSEGAGDANPLFHPTGKLMRPPLRRTFQAHQLQAAFDDFLRLFFGHALQLKSERIFARAVSQGSNSAC